LLQASGEKICYNMPKDLSGDESPISEQLNKLCSMLGVMRIVIDEPRSKTNDDYGKPKSMQLPDPLGYHIVN